MLDLVCNANIKNGYCSVHGRGDKQVVEMSQKALDKFIERKHA